MKKYILFLLASMFFGFSYSNYDSRLSNFNKQKNFTFIENGITFSIFQNGEFDFYLSPEYIQSNVNFRNINISYNSGFNYDSYLQYDQYGAIIQIQNVPVFYDYYGRVNRIGNVKIGYRSNRLTYVGGLNIYYNNYGNYNYHTGFVNSYNRYYSFHPYHNYFVQPVYNRCVVSYVPYRKYYQVKRHPYYKGKKHKHKKKSFTPVNKRVRIANGQKNNSKNDKRYTHRKKSDYGNSRTAIKQENYKRKNANNIVSTSYNRSKNNKNQKTVQKQYKRNSNLNSVKSSNKYSTAQRGKTTSINNRKMSKNNRSKSNRSL